MDRPTLFTRLVGDFAKWPASSARLIDEAACLASVMLAIAWSHLLGIGNVGWAAFSAYIVMRTSFAESARRGMLRMFGTAVGVSLACCLAPQLLRSTALLSAALALCAAVTLYLALIDRRGYGWLLAGLSFAMVLVDGMEQPHQALGAFAQARLIEVSVGSGAAMLVSAVSTLAVRRRPPAAPDDMEQDRKQDPPAPVSRLRHRLALRHALQGALALALIPWVWAAFHLKALGQSSITIMAVMMVPIADLSAPAYPASTRLRHRFLGCAIGGLLATVVLILSHASPTIMTLAVCLGVVAGRHIENGETGITYAGTQFALAFLVVLVADGTTAPDTAQGVERLFGILLGMALLEPVRLLFRWCVPAPELGNHVKLIP
jgi:uncharacterized membrane protein YccC